MALVYKLRIHVEALQNNERGQMPEIKLTEEEQADLNIHGRVIETTKQQITTLAVQRQRSIKDSNWIWKFITATRGKGKKPPKELFAPDGSLTVTFKDGVASWEAEVEEKES